MKKIIIISIFSLIFSLNTNSQRLYEEEALEVGIKSIDNFREFLSLKNDANYKTELEPLIQWGIDNFQKYGFDIERLETPELPLLLASKIISKKAKTILIYLQFDGQPVDNSKWDQENPYKAELKIYENGEYKSIDWNALENITTKNINATVKIKSVKINKIVVADKAPVLPYSNIGVRASAASDVYKGQIIVVSLQKRRA